MKKFLFLLIMSYCWLPLVGCSLQASPMRPQIDISITGLKETVQKLSTTEPPRSFSNPESLDQVARYIKSKFSEYGLSPVEQVYQVDKVAYKNVVASYGPPDAPVLVVGAHYDVFGDLPGADDNASGVAGLIELARLLHTQQPKLNYRIELVAFTLEEPPFFRSFLMGSYVHAKSLYEQDVEVIGMVCLEMIGYFSSAKKSQNYPVPLMRLFYPGTGNFIALVGNFGSSSLSGHFRKNFAAESLEVRQLHAPSFVPGVDFSDHMNYWKFGYKAIMITDTSFYRNANYHQETDTIDTLDFEKMAEVVRGVYWGLVNLKK